MALGLGATLGLVLGYLEVCPDPLEVAESTPYAAWRRLCMHVCSEPSTAADVLSIIIKEREAVTGVRYCPAHQLVAELVLALNDPSTLATAAEFQPMLVSAACGLLNSPKGTTQSAQVQLGTKMLAALVSSSTVFTEYVAQWSALTAALGAALYAPESGPEVRPAVTALINLILATSPAAKANFLACVSRLISRRDSTGQQKPGQPTTMAGLVGRPHGVSVLEVLLSLPEFSMTAELQSTAMQGVLGLLQDVYATHSPAPTHPAAATSAGTASSIQCRVLRLKLSGKAPAPAAGASPAQPAALPEAAAAAGPPAAAAGGSAEQPQHALSGPEPTAAAPVASDAAAGRSAQQAQQAPLQAAPAAPSTEPTAAGEPAAAAPQDAAPAGGSAQAPRPARVKPLPPALLQLVLRTLSKLTEAQPQHMAQQMTQGVLNTLLSLLDPSMQHLACKADAAAIVMDCLCWACVTARSTPPAESLIDLFMAVKHVSIVEAIHLLETSCELSTRDGKQRAFALLQAITHLADRLVPMGAGSEPEAGAAVSKAQQGRAVVARRLAKIPGLLQMLRDRVNTMDRAGTGASATAVDLLFPHYTQNQQDRIAWIPEFLERHQYVTFLAELLEHPSDAPAHAGQVACVAHLLLQCARAAPVHTLRASHLQKAPRSRSPGAQSAQSAQTAQAVEPDGQQDDKISVVLSALIAAMQPRLPLSASSSSSSKRCAELSLAAVHAAEALSILASQALGASELARPAAVERLLQLLQAAARPGSWDVQSLQDSADLKSGSTAQSPRPAGLSEASGRYKAALRKVPGIICQAAALNPSLAPKLQQASPKAAFLLAAALRLHHQSANLPEGSQAFPAAAVQLAEAWPALAGFLRPLPGWREWSSDIHAHLQPGQEQQAQQQQQSVLKGLNRQCFAHEPADLSLCTWGAAAAPTQEDAPELDDTCSSQLRQQGPGSASTSDRMSLDDSSWPTGAEAGAQADRQQADCVVFVVPVSTSAKAGAAETDAKEPLSPPSSPLKRKLQLTEDATTTAATTTAAEQQQQRHEGSPAKVRALSANTGTERAGSPAQRFLAFTAAATAPGAHQEQQRQQQSGGTAHQQQQTPNTACQHSGEEAPVPFDVAEALIDLSSTQQQLNNQQHGAGQEGGESGEGEEPAGWWRQRQAQLVRALSGDLQNGAVQMQASGLQAGQQQLPATQQQQQAAAAAAAAAAAEQQSETEREEGEISGGDTAEQAGSEPVTGVIAAKAQQGQPQQAQQAQQQQLEGDDDDLTEIVDGSDSTSSDDDAVDSGSSSGVIRAGSGSAGGNSGRTGSAGSNSGRTGSARSNSSSGSGSGRGGGLNFKFRRDRREDKLVSLRAAAAAPGVQALLGSLGFGQAGNGSTESPAKAMLAESVKDGKIVFVPQKKSKGLPEKDKQAAKESGHIVAARMWRKGQRSAGAVWGYGWGRDKEAAEKAAAEAAVAHMYVCGVRFAELPPYTGPGPV